MRPAGHTITRIAAKANVNPSTVRRWADGGKVSGTTAQAIKEACEALGITFYREVTTGFSGGSSSAIGVSTHIPTPDRDTPPREEKLR